MTFVLSIAMIIHTIVVVDGAGRRILMVNAIISKIGGQNVVGRKLTTRAD